MAWPDDDSDSGPDGFEYGRDPRPKSQLSRRATPRDGPADAASAPLPSLTPAASRQGSAPLRREEVARGSAASGAFAIAALQGHMPVLLPQQRGDPRAPVATAAAAPAALQPSPGPKAPATPLPQQPRAHPAQRQREQSPLTPPPPSAAQAVPSPKGAAEEPDYGPYGGDSDDDYGAPKKGSSGKKGSGGGGSAGAGAGAAAALMARHGSLRSLGSMGSRAAAGGRLASPSPSLSPSPSPRADGLRERPKSR
ncbi:hypothetical protein MNEG_14211, partial [Monoraphidium neglectum]